MLKDLFLALQKRVGQEIFKHLIPRVTWNNHRSVKMVAKYCGWESSERSPSGTPYSGHVVWKNLPQSTWPMRDVQGLGVRNGLVFRGRWLKSPGAVLLPSSNLFLGPDVIQREGRSPTLEETLQEVVLNQSQDAHPASVSQKFRHAIAFSSE